MNALLNLKKGKNDTVEYLLDIAEKTEKKNEDFKTFINKAYNGEAE